MLRKRSQYILQACLMAVYLISALAYADVDDSGIKVKWGYTGNIGPSRWGQLDKKFLLCSAGKAQSPINISKKVANIKSALRINYQSAPMTIVEDGATDLMMGSVQTIIDDGHSVQLNFPKALESITLDGKDYSLVQFHLHTPSENLWHGRSFPMEIHFVHQGQDGTAAVMGVFVKSGKENAALQKIIDNLPKEKGKERVIPGERLNPMDLIPSKQAYYGFLGSLTTPPCSEDVQWLVMQNPITASPGQILSLRKAMGGTNARPVQPLNGRDIALAQDEK